MGVIRWLLSRLFGTPKTPPGASQRDREREVDRTSLSPPRQAKELPVVAVRALGQEPIQVAKPEPIAFVAREASVPVLMTQDQIKDALWQIQKLSGWDDPSGEHLATLAGYKAKLLAHDPNIITEIEYRVSRGRQAGELVGRVKEMAYRHPDRQHPDVVAAFDSIRAANRSDLLSFAETQFEKQAERGRAKQQTRRDNAVHTGPRVVGKKLNRIDSLQPQAQWSVVIDETGNQWDDADAISDTPVSQHGRVVALLIPEGIDQVVLPPLARDWHATSLPAKDVDKAVQAVLDSGVGIFGIKATALPTVGGAERWLHSVLEVIHWVLLLVPIDGPTRIAVSLEQRGTHAAGHDWQAAAEALKRELAYVRPEVGLVSLTIKLIGKEGHPYNGYVDAIAYTWGAASKESSERLKESKLAGSCLFDLSSDELRRIHRLVWSGQRPVPSDWAALVNSSGAEQNGLIKTLLTAVASQCQANPSHWRTYMAATRRLLEQGAFDVGIAARQLDWLAKCAPKTETMDALTRFVWLSTQLARDNHIGGAQPDMHKELAVLRRQLFEEVAPTVCHCDLRLAVSATNQFDFAAARVILTPWLEHPVAVCGTQNYGRVLSSLGQVSAFEGKTSEAIQFFDQALACFARLSDADLARQEAMQTRTYRAIAMIDDLDIPTHMVRLEIESVTGPLGDALVALGASDVEQKYLQHLVLRYLAYRGTAQEKAAYLGSREEWETGGDHPWELIAFYRGLLLSESDAAAAQAQFRRAWTIAGAARQGATVRLIGAAICLAADPKWKHSETELAELRKQLPGAGPYLDRLEQAARGGEPPAKILANGLPFNFR